MVMALWRKGSRKPPERQTTEARPGEESAEVMQEEPVQTVQQWFAAWNARDFDALRAMYSPAAAHLRPDGFSQGADAIVSYLRTVAAELPGETAVVDAVLVGSDAVAVEWTASLGPETTATRARM